MVLRRYSGCHANFGDGAIDQVAQCYQATVQYGTRRSGQPDIARFDGGKRERGGMDEIAQLVCEKAEPFTQRLLRFLCNQSIALVGNFLDGIGDGVVQAAVERSKLGGLDWRIAFKL